MTSLEAESKASPENVTLRTFEKVTNVDLMNSHITFEHRLESFPKEKFSALQLRHILSYPSDTLHLKRHEVTFLRRLLLSYRVISYTTSIGDYKATAYQDKEEIRAIRAIAWKFKDGNYSEKDFRENLEEIISSLKSDLGDDPLNNLILLPDAKRDERIKRIGIDTSVVKSENGNALKESDSQGDSQDKGFKKARTEKEKLSYLSIIPAEEVKHVEKLDIVTLRSYADYLKSLLRDQDSVSYQNNDKFTVSNVDFLIRLGEAITGEYQNVEEISNYLTNYHLISLFRKFANYLERHPEYKNIEHLYLTRLALQEKWAQIEEQKNTLANISTS